MARPYDNPDDKPAFEPPGLTLRDAPGRLADRLGVSPTAVVIGVLAVAAAAIGAWWAFATPAPAPEVVLPSASEVSIPIEAPLEPEPVAIWVDVGGAVRSPGLHELPAGSRVDDAIEAAGGLAADADLSRLNRALILADQQRVWVPRLGEDLPEGVAGDVGTSTGSSGSGAGAGQCPVNVNTAGAAALESLPGIGPVLAAAIVEHRNSHGSFSTLDDLLDVSGIGPAKLEQLRPCAAT